MLLNKLEFLAMNNPIRRILQRSVEIKRLRAISQLKSGKNIIEIGCGSGYGTKLINEYFKPKAITAIDLDSRMIELAQKINTNPRVTYAVGDVTNLAFPANTFDAIIDFAIIHHIPNWEACLKELYRVLRPGGEIIIEDGSIESFETTVGRLLRTVLTHPYAEMYRLDGFTHTLKQIGFMDVKVKKYMIFGGYVYFVLVAKK